MRQLPILKEVNTMSFPTDFKWGAATASFQIEGGYEERGECIWDLFCRTPDKVAFGHDGKTACDHYHRFREDISIMKELGLKSYRFSLSWPRLIEGGDGKIRPEGVRFYNELIDALLENGIEPYVTLYHWDLPIELYYRGGWLSPEMPKWFAYYTKTAAELFSDRVTHWFTLNETACFISVSYANGVHAPGLKLSEAEVMRCAHIANLSHGEAVKTLRAFAKKPPKIGFAPVGDACIPASDSAEDIAAAREAMFAPRDPHYWGAAIWIEPIMRGKYCDELMELFERSGVRISDADMKLIGQELDFMGMNIYHAPYVGKNGTVPPRAGHEQTAMGWPVTPEALYWGPKFFYERYHKPIYITENGMADNDFMFSDGRVHDPRRIEFLTRYLKCLKKACEDGVDVRGYFQWSLLDNFEWADGYQKRFGLVYVDYETQKRTLKDSAYWYKNIIASNGDTL